eukprot:241766_1
MARSSSRLNGLIAELDEHQTQCLQTLVKSNCRTQAVGSLKSFLSGRLLTLNDIDSILYIMQQPVVKKHSRDKPMVQLLQQSDKILLIHNKLKSSSKFRLRDNMGKLGKIQLDIGKDINELNLSCVSTTDINSLTRQWATTHIQIQQIDEDIDKEDEGIMKFDLEIFCKTIDSENRRKKQLLAVKNGKKRKRVVMKDKTNSQNTNKKNTNNNKPKQISNNKSHIMRTKYSQMVQLEQYLNTKYEELMRKKDLLIETAKSFGIIDNQAKCKQEDSWTSPFNNDITAKLVGSKAYSRYKNEIKSVKTIQMKLIKKQRTLKNLMNDGIWRKNGKLRGTKTMRERVDDYELEKQKRKDKYVPKRKAANNNVAEQPPHKKQKINSSISSYFKKL